MVKRFCLRLMLVALWCAIVFSASTKVFAACLPNQQPCNGGCISEKDLCLLEPLPGGPNFLTPDGTAFGSFFAYLNLGVWDWAFMMGVAIAVLNGVVGGFQITMSNGDSGKVDEGKKRFINSAIGLIMLLLTGVFLAFLNPTGFVNG